MTGLVCKISMGLIFLFAYQFHLIAQIQIIEKSTTESDDRIITIIENEKTKTRYTIFENRLGRINIQNGPKAGLEYEKVSSGVLTDNHNILFEPFESFLFLKEDIIYTTKLDWKNYKKIISKYKLNDSLILQRKIICGSIETSIVFNKSKNIIIVNNLSEGYGSNFIIVSDQLDILDNYKPFDSGYEISIFGSDDDSFFLIAKSFDIASSYKVAIFDNKDGEMKFEFVAPFDEAHKIANASIHIDKLILSLETNNSSTDNKLVSINFTGDIIWSYSYPDPAYQPFIYYIPDNGSLITNTLNEVLAIDINTGIKIWDFSLNSYYPEIMSANRAKVIPLAHSLLLQNTMIGIVLGEIVTSGGVPKGFINENLFVLDLEGILQKHITYTNPIYEVYLISLNQNQFILINDNKLHHYEKND